MVDMRELALKTMMNLRGQMSVAITMKHPLKSANDRSNLETISRLRIFKKHLTLVSKLWKDLMSRCTVTRSLLCLDTMVLENQPQSRSWQVSSKDQKVVPKYMTLTSSKKWVKCVNLWVSAHNTMSYLTSWLLRNISAFSMISRAEIQRKKKMSSRKWSKMSVWRLIGERCLTHFQEETRENYLSALLFVVAPNSCFWTSQLQEWTLEQDDTCGICWWSIKKAVS